MNKTEEILKLAKECGIDVDAIITLPPKLEAFYKAAYNKAIADSLYVATPCDPDFPFGDDVFIKTPQDLIDRAVFGDGIDVAPLVDSSSNAGIER